MNSVRNVFRILILLLFIFFSLTAKPTASAVRHKDGEKKMCLIDGIFAKKGKRFARIDIVERFEGARAIRAYRKDHPKGGDPPPNGYYYRNRIVRFDTLEIARTAQYVMQTYSRGEDGNFRFNESIGFDAFSRLFSKDGIERYRHTPFRISVSRHLIVSLQEQYLP